MPNFSWVLWGIRESLLRICRRWAEDGQTAVLAEAPLVRRGRAMAAPTGLLLGQQLLVTKPDDHSIGLTDHDGGSVRRSIEEKQNSH